MVYDLQTAANDIQLFVAKMTYDDYHTNKLVKAAVERNRLDVIQGKLPALIEDLNKFDFS